MYNQNSFSSDSLHSDFEHHYLSSQMVRSLLNFMKGKGIDVKQVCRDLSIQEEMLYRSEDYFPASCYLRLLDIGKEETGDNHFGFHFGMHAEPERWGITGHIMAFCPHLAAALSMQQKYQALVGNIGQVHQETYQGLVTLTWRTVVAPPRHVAEEVPAGWVAFARWITQTELGPSEVFFQHDTVGDKHIYEEFFGCPVLFTRSSTGLTFPKEFLTLPLKQPDNTMLDLLGLKAKLLLSEIANDLDLSDKLQVYVIKHLPLRDISLSGAACHVNLSPRTLQRRLQGEGKSFKDFVDEVRQNIAVKHLNQGRCNLIELSFLLGFSEQSAFQRAFKRWTGITPGQYIRQLMDEK